MSIPLLHKGLFIVIDGTDGAGKATQTDLLVRHLRRDGHRVSLVDFPQYGKPSAAMVEAYLNGKFGTAAEVGPYRSAIFFAVDRYAARAQIRKWLDNGRIVISNRYVTANMGHQGAKIVNPRERRAFFRWLDDLEFGIFGIPRPDCTLILHVPAHIAQTLVSKKGYRAYIGKKKLDIHEADLRHLAAAEAAYLDIARTTPKTHLIECFEHGRLLTPEEVHCRIWGSMTSIVPS